MRCCGGGQLCCAPSWAAATAAAAGAAHPCTPSQSVAPAHLRCRVRETAKAAKDMGVRHVMNLGHGIMQVGAVQSCSVLAFLLLFLCKACGHGIMQVSKGRAQRAVRSTCVLSQPGPLLCTTHLCPGTQDADIPSCWWVHPLQGTPEENAAHFFKVAKELRYADL